MIILRSVKLEWVITLFQREINILMVWRESDYVLIRRQPVEEKIISSMVGWIGSSWTPFFAALLGRLLRNCLTLSLQKANIYLKCYVFFSHTIQGTPPLKFIFKCFADKERFFPTRIKNTLLALFHYSYFETENTNTLFGHK